MQRELPGETRMKTSRSSLIPRQKLSTTLRKIAAKIGEQPVRSITWIGPNDYFHRGERVSMKIRITKLFAFGSWARGAESCGDLDLAVEYEIEEQTPQMSFLNFGALKRNLVNGYRGVELLPWNKIRENVEIQKDAILIWSVDQVDYQSRIDEIKVDPNSGHYERAWDSMPIDMKRLKLDVKEAETFVADVESGIYSVEWVPATEISEAKESYPDNLKQKQKDWTWFAGRHIAALLNRSLDYVVSEMVVGDLEINAKRFCQSTYKLAGNFIALGTPYPPFELLSDLSYSALIIAPYDKNNSPNGLMIVRRGEKHPLVAKAAKIDNIYSVFNKQNGEPALLYSYSAENELCANLMVFSNKSAAADEAAVYDSDEYEVKKLSGNSLLNNLTLSNGIILNDDFSMFFEREVCSLEASADWLSEFSGKILERG